MTTATFNLWAIRDFDRAVSKAYWRDWFSRLVKKNNDLISFEEIRRALPFKGQRYLGVQFVPLANIVGSEGRYRDFDRTFFPRQDHSRSRWVSIDKAHYQAVALPPVELFKIAEVYFVRDGHHRISVARARGQEFIDAYVTEIDAPVSLKVANY
jgi:hypothetical protein